MPVDAARLDAFLGDPNIPEEEKRTLVAKVRAQRATPSTASSVYPQPGSNVSVTGALKEGLGNIGSAVKSVVGPSTQALQRLTSLPSQKDPTVGGVASDVATVAGTALAPEVTAAQIGVGAGTRALAPESTAKTAETVTGVAGLAPQAVSSGIGAVKAARAAVPAAIRTAGTTLREGLPSAAKALSKRVQGQFYEPVAAYAKERGLGLAPGSTEANTVADAIDAAHAKWGPTAEGEKLLTKLRPTVSTERAAGLSVDAATPLPGETWIGAPQRHIIRRNGQEVGHVDIAKRGNTLEVDHIVVGDPFTKEGQPGPSEIRNLLRQVTSLYPDVKTVRGLRISGIRQGGVAEGAEAVFNVPKARPVTPVPALVTYEDLDAAKRLLPGRAKEARGAIDSAIDNLFTGEHAAAGAKLRSGKAAWKLEVAPARKLANRVANAEDPETALRLLADAKHPARAQIAEKLLGGTEDDWKNVLDGIDALRPARGAKLGSYMQRHAIHTGVLGTIFGGPAGALGGLAMYGAGTGIKYAGQAGAFLKGGLAGRPAAAALADTISAWGESQEDEKAKGAARDVAGALRAGTPRAAAQPLSQSPNTPDTGTYASASPSPQRGVALPYSREVSRVAQVVGLNPSLLHAVMRQESGGNPNAVSEANAQGLMQILPATFEEVRPEVERLVGRRADLHNPIDNIAAGALLYKRYLSPQWTSGNIEQAARYYHGGPNIDIHGPKTQSYGRSVAALYNRFKGGPGYGG